MFEPRECSRRVYIGKGVSVGQGLKVVVGAGFSKTERDAWTGETGGSSVCGGVQAWAELVQT